MLDEMLHGEPIVLKVLIKSMGIKNLSTRTIFFEHQQKNTRFF